MNPPSKEIDFTSSKNFKTVYNVQRTFVKKTPLIIKELYLPPKRQLQRESVFSLPPLKGKLRMYYVHSLTHSLTLF